MYIGAEEIIKAAAVISALTVICGFLIAAYKWYARQNVTRAGRRDRKDKERAMPCDIWYSRLSERA